MSDQQRSPSADDEPFVPTGEPNALPAGKLFEANPNTWYNLKAQYLDERGNPTSGLMYPLGQNPSTSFWDYMVLGGSVDGLPPAKFKVETWDKSPNWQKWTLDNGNTVCLKATGWVYRASAYTIGWQIIDGYLYNSYWTGQVGYSWDDVLVPDACYMGMKLPPFTCELVPAE